MMDSNKAIGKSFGGSDGVMADGQMPRAFSTTFVLPLISSSPTASIRIPTVKSGSWSVVKCTGIVDVYAFPNRLLQTLYVNMPAIKMLFQMSECTEVEALGEVFRHDLPAMLASEFSFKAFGTQ